MPAPRLPLAAFAFASLLGGCAGPSARHPLAGRARPEKGEASYAIYTRDGWLYVRVAGGDNRVHRFQGSVTAYKGQLGALELDGPALAEQVASHGPSIQFDIEPRRGSEDGFRVRVDEACLRFDLYVDGAHRPERVYLSGRRTHPRNIPFERCP